MSKITNVGKGFIQVDNTLYNLNGYINIEKYIFGYDEGDAFGISLTPLTVDEETLQSGTKGTFFISTYKSEEEEEFNADFETIIEALKD